MAKPIDPYDLLRRGGEMTAAEQKLLAESLIEGKLAELAGGLKSRTSDQPVKVVPISQAQPPRTARGYFTQQKYIAGKTPLEMEAILGIFGKLRNGAHILHFVQPLAAGTFESRAYTYLPDGRPYQASPNETVYLPGKGAPQWVLTQEVWVQCIATLAPHQVYLVRKHG